MRRGNLFVISGPSGVGKGTIVSLVMDRIPDARLSVSATTRQPREGEIDGVHYHFVSDEEFRRLVAEDGFLEWADYGKHCYGSPRAFVEQCMAEGKQVILEIETVGAMQVRQAVPEAHLVFIEPPSFEELESRLRGRGSESEEQIQLRLATARLELAKKMEYDMRLVNDDLGRAVDELVAYINDCAEE